MFQKMLIEGGIATYIRRPRGRDIYAACGQLKRTVAERGRSWWRLGRRRFRRNSARTARDWLRDDM